MSLLLLPCFAFASQGTPVSFLETVKVILPLAGCGVVAALAGLWVSAHEQHVLLQLFLGAGASGLVYLLLAAALIIKAAIYRELRNRVVILSRGFVEEARARTMLYRAR
jgi:hypothetical protein